MRWGDDDPDACRLHREVYNMLERHFMGITASQFVLQEHGKIETTENGAAPTGEHGPNSRGGDDDALVERGGPNAGGEPTPTQQPDEDAVAPNARKRPNRQTTPGGHDESN